jgi:hypothetical protein
MLILEFIFRSSGRRVSLFPKNFDEKIPFPVCFKLEKHILLGRSDYIRHLQKAIFGIEAVSPQFLLVKKLFSAHFGASETQSQKEDVLFSSQSPHESSFL